MATPERDTVYTRDDRTVYTRDGSGTGWFIGIIVALALLAIGYMVWSASTQPTSTTIDVNNTPAITEPAPMAPAGDTIVVTPPADTVVVDPAPMTPAAPVETTPAPVETAPATPAPAAPAEAPATL